MKEKHSLFFQEVMLPMIEIQRMYIAQPEDTIPDEETKELFPDWTHPVLCRVPGFHEQKITH